VRMKKAGIGLGAIVLVAVFSVFGNAISTGQGNNAGAGANSDTTRSGNAIIPDGVVAFESKTPTPIIAPTPSIKSQILNSTQVSSYYCADCNNGNNCHCTGHCGEGSYHGGHANPCQGQGQQQHHASTPTPGTSPTRPSSPTPRASSTPTATLVPTNTPTAAPTPCVPPPACVACSTNAIKAEETFARESLTLGTLKTVAVELLKRLGFTPIGVSLGIANFVKDLNEQAQIIADLAGCRLANCPPGC
jgi:hypothetical protein